MALYFASLKQLSKITMNLRILCDVVIYYENSTYYSFIKTPTNT